MSTVNQNTIRTPRMRLRSATRRQIARQNSPSVLARRRSALETQRTNLANKIAELELGLIDARKLLAEIIIEVDQAKRREEDERDRYLTLRAEEVRLRGTIIDNFNQSDLGMEYNELQKRYYEYLHNKDEDTDIDYFNNLKTRLDYIHGLFREQIKSGLAPIIVEKEIANGIYNAASKNYERLYKSQQGFMRVISNFEQEIEKALKRDRQLNQARGKRQRRTRHKKGKAKTHN
jgi:hypothetical protein